MFIAWERGGTGQLGNDNTQDKTNPVLVRKEAGFLENIIETSAGYKSSIALSIEGKIYAWGDNSNGKLGISEKISKYAKQIIDTNNLSGEGIKLIPMEVIEAGRNHSCISDKNGFVYATGQNISGQLGTKDNNSRTIFTQIGDINITTKPEELQIPVDTSKEISMELGYSFNLKKTAAEIGDLSLINTNNKEIEVEDQNTQGTISSIKNYKLTGRKIGRVNLVVSSDEGYSKNIWVEVVDSEKSKASSKVVNGEGFTLALKSDGTVWTFGAINGKSNPEEIEAPEEIIDIACGKSHILLLGKSGAIYSLGQNIKGQCGTGDVTALSIPTKINIKNIAKVIAQDNTSFAITTSGKVYAWGEGYTKSPELLENEGNVIDISKNYYLLEDGILRKNIDNEKIEINGKERIIQISEGNEQEILLLGESGKVYTYKEGEMQAIEITKEDGAILQNVKEISAGSNYNIAVTTEKEVYTWGDNENQKLGFNYDDIKSLDYPSKKDDIRDVERVVAGASHTSVYKRNGDVYTWGLGENGELGNGESFNVSEAQLVGKNIIETNTNNITIQTGKTFDIEAYLNYFNLFKDQKTNLIYEVLDQDLAMINETTGEIVTIKQGRTTVIVKDTKTGKIAVINVIILDNGSIEPMVETKRKSYSHAKSRWKCMDIWT
ncbi:MAG: hypothetical protein HFJ51_05195 [Clostridia bacterium]|nr:hypothetical protein [Clostridia bacterium]